MATTMVDHIRNPVWGQTLRAKVAESGLSQRAFAERHGFVSRTFNSWCNGRWPGEKTAREVAKALGIEYAALISDRIISVDADLLKTVVTVVDERTSGIALSSEIRARLYYLAYEHLAIHQSRQELSRHVNHLLELSAR